MGHHRASRQTDNNNARKRMNKPPGLDLVERARALQPLIARDADEIERTRRLTPAVTAGLIENGLYRALLPQSLGGAEAPLETFMQMQEEIAKADASTAWCLGQCSVCAMTAAYLDPDAANEIFNVAPGILAWGAINHEVQAVPGGYKASARWDFASGSRQASWLGAHVRVVEADGSPRRKPDGSPEIRTILFPVASATMYDVWDVIGLRGTGTDSYSVDNLFIPDKFAALRDDPTALRENGPLYKMSTNMVFSMGFGATSLGLARATLDAAIDLARGKTPQGLKAMRDNNAVQGLIGRTEATLRAARAYLYATAAEVWRDLARGDAITEQHRIALRIAATWTIHQSASVVDTAYHMAGATAVFNANKLERRFRDMHTIAQQIQGRDSHYEDVGKAILSANLGTPPTAR
jgi:alkylation response protein AidB-like acyl-CoA dehydrogenase